MGTALAAKKKTPAKKKKERNDTARIKTGETKTTEKTSGNHTPKSVTSTTKKGKTPITKRDPGQHKFSGTFPVVGLGASAGGLEALETFFRAMPVDGGMAFIVVMHQAAKHVSLLPELLTKCTQMRVVAIAEGTALQQNFVYIVPPGKHVNLLSNTLHLTTIPERHGVTLPIDHFFRSLAEDRKEMSVAIVLSGTGTDGTVGLSAIKGSSGMVMVQSVESAKFDGMPRSAIEAGWADYILAPDAMPMALIAYARGPFLKAPQSVDGAKPAVSSSMPEILLLLRRRCGHDFSGYKTNTIWRRIERRMSVHQIDEPKNYLRYLGEHETESGLLFKDLLIGVTSFFRDELPFESLSRNAIIPMLKEKSNDANFRAWVPGCSTGEEAYSIAILLRECMDKLKIHLNVQIFATDLDATAIETARNGRFLTGISTDVSAQRLAQFFTKSETGYRIRKELRDWLVFAPQNVIHDPPFTKLDLVSCRNLLIYLQSDLQKKLLNLFHYSLKPGGALFLGTSESIGDFGDVFATIDKKSKIFCRKETAHAERNVKFPITASPTRENRTPTVDQPSRPIDVDAAMLEMLAVRFAPPTVIVKGNGEIIQIYGRTGLFLELASGGPPKNVVDMAREGLATDLSVALRKASREGGLVVHKNVSVRTNGDTVLIDLSVERIDDPKPLFGFFRISFQIVTDPKPAKLESKSSVKTKTRVKGLEKELERELQHARESLQRSLQERDASNEEMKSTNEELQSTNEELQSTNEELETSKEELQSLNEELQTVNAEFQDKIGDLSRANDDMMNLLNSTDIATIFLDNQLRIKRYTESAKRVIHLIPSDLGRPLGDLTTLVKDLDLAVDAREVLKTLVFKERELRCDDGHWLLMRVVPYRTFENRIDGLVMSFIDIDEMKRNEHVRDFAKHIVETIRESMLVLDPELRVLSANDSFYRTFEAKEESTVGTLIYDLGNGQWDIPALRELLEQILPKNNSFDDFEVRHEFPTIGEKRMFLNARRITSDDGTPNSILLAIEDVS